jgi:hypothetical protein
MNTQAPQQPDTRVIFWFGWGLVALGVPMFLFGIYFALLADDSKDWPKAEGTVTSSAVRTHVSVDQTNRAFSENDSDRTYYPEFRYSYTVDGQSYSSSRYALGESAPAHAQREDAQKAASKHPAGSKIDVFYDPGDPGSAVLRPGASTGSWVPLLLGLFFGGSGLFLLRMLRKLKPAK